MRMRAGVYVALMAALVVALTPIVWMLLTAIAEGDGGALEPARWTLHNFTRAMKTGNFPRLLLNSFVVASASALLNVVFDSMAAFAFARLEFPGRRILFAATLASMLLPTVLTVVPLFLIVRAMPGGEAGWVNSYAGLVAPTASSAFGIFLLRQHFSTLPRDLDEAARLDGASIWRIYWDIAVPLSKPALATVGIFSFVLAWNDFLWPLVVATDASMYTVQVGLSYFTTEHSVRWPLLMAAATLVTLPVALLYFALQRYFVHGIAATGLRE